MKKILTLFLVIFLIGITTGLLLIHFKHPKGQIITGLSVCFMAFILMPTFIYHRQQLGKYKKYQINDDLFSFKLKTMELTNKKIKTYEFLKVMYQNDYYPNKLVNKGRTILINLCLEIEKNKPKNLEELYKLTHKATNKFNNLKNEFNEYNSEIETIARDCIGSDFKYIAEAYGFNNTTIEELLATRNW